VREVPRGVAFFIESPFTSTPSMSTSRAQHLKFAKQSERRVRSGIMLVVLLVASSGIGVASDSPVLWKLSAVAAGLFGVVTLAEYINARRRRQQAANVER
jgi:hypothetical protein